MIASKVPALPDGPQTQGYTEAKNAHSKVDIKLKLTYKQVSQATIIMIKSYPPKHLVVGK